MAARLTEKQRRFVDFFVETANATEAAIRAGYSKRTAAQTGSENLRKPHIAAAIEKRNKELEDERIADMVEVKRFWTSMMRDPEAQATDRLKASEFIAKTNAAFRDRVEHTGTDGKPLFEVVVVKPPVIADDDEDED
jgi:phage terminase small subunit